MSYRDVVALNDVDAVMIASPDCHHTTHLKAAAEAGKDAYCEKPLAMDMEGLRQACDAVKKAEDGCPDRHAASEPAELHGLPRAVQDRDSRQSGADRAVPQRREAVLVLLHQGRQAGRRGLEGIRREIGPRGRSIRSSTPAGTATASSPTARSAATAATSSTSSTTSPGRRSRPVA